MEKPENKEQARPKASQQRGYVSEPMHTSKGICFLIRWRVRNGDGSSIQKSERLYVASKQEARAILDQRIQQAAAAATPSLTLCVRDFLFGLWWPYKERQGLSRSTRRSYQAIINNVVPSICMRALREVTPLDIHRIVAQRRRQAQPKTVLNEVRLLSNIFALAVNLGLLERNPVERQHQPHLEPAATATWTLAQIRDIVATVPEEYRALMTAAAVSELRLCELLNLGRDDIDFERQTLRVRKVRAGRKAACRLVPVGPLLLQVLAGHLERTPPSPPANLVFPNPAGEKLNPHLLKKHVLYLTLGRLRLPRRGAGFDSFRCSRKALLTAAWGDPQLLAAVAEQRRRLAAAPVASPWAEKRALALALEQAILGDASVAVPQQEPAEAPAAPQPPAENSGKLRRMTLDIPPANGGAAAAAPAAAAEAQHVAQEGGKLRRRQLDIPPANSGEQAAAPPQTENPLQQKIKRLRLEAFLGGGL